MFSLSLFVTLIWIDLSRHFRTCQFKSLGGPAISEEYLKSKRAGWEKRREQMVTEMPWATWNDFNKEEDEGMWWSDYLAASSIKIQHFFFWLGCHLNSWNWLSFGMNWWITIRYRLIEFWWNLNEWSGLNGSWKIFPRSWHSTATHY